MSDKISELPVASEAIAGNDLVAVTNVSQPGTGETQKFRQDQLGIPVKATAAELNIGTDDAKFATALAIATRSESTGWTPVRGTFSWASVSTINIAAGGASKYNVGDRLKWVTATGSTQRYATVATVADTLLTIAVNTDHVLVNEAWTLPFYSHQASPVGFPQKFNYTPILTNMAGGTIDIAKFMLIGKRVFLTFRYICAGADISGAVFASLPIDAADMNWLHTIGFVTFKDSNPATNYYGIVLASPTSMIFRIIKADTTYATWADISSTVPYTWAAGDSIMAEVSYFI